MCFRIFLVFAVFGFFIHGQSDSLIVHEIDINSEEIWQLVEMDLLTVEEATVIEEYVLEYGEIKDFSELIRIKGLSKTSRKMLMSNCSINQPRKAKRIAFYRWKNLDNGYGSSNLFLQQKSKDHTVVVNLNREPSLVDHRLYYSKKFQNIGLYFGHFQSTTLAYYNNINSFSTPADVYRFSKWEKVPKIGISYVKKSIGLDINKGLNSNNMVGHFYVQNTNSQIHWYLNERDKQEVILNGKRNQFFYQLNWRIDNGYFRSYSLQGRYVTNKKLYWVYRFKQNSEFGQHLLSCVFGKKRYRQKVRIIKGISDFEQPIKIAYWSPNFKKRTTFYVQTNSGFGYWFISFRHKIYIADQMTFQLISSADIVKDKIRSQQFIRLNYGAKRFKFSYVIGYNNGLKGFVNMPNLEREFSRYYVRDQKWLNGGIISLDWKNFNLGLKWIQTDSGVGNQLSFQLLYSN